jgi:RNA polymerase sigma factor (sigma-70 family)
MTEKPDRECPDFAAMAKEGKIEPALLDQIIHCFSERLLRFARYRCEDGTLAEDAMQDSMIGLIQNLDSYRGEAPIEPWLRKLVVSACSRLRRGRKNSPTLHTAMDDLMADRLEDPSAQDRVGVKALSSELGRIEAAIRDLPEPNRTMLLLHETEEIPIEELATRFEMTSDAVKSRLKRSRSRLRQDLAWLRE